MNKDELNKYRKTILKYPMLFLSRNTYLDVANENTSNWMRYVRLAANHQEQNLLICEIDSKLYFKSCKFIKPKQLLCVGYSKEYAEKYSLMKLPSESIERTKAVVKHKEWSCTKNNIASRKTHDTEPLKTENGKIQLPPMRATLTKTNETSSPIKSKHRLNTGAIRMRKLALSKNSRETGPTVRYACCYCSKVFSKFLSYKKHTKAIHSVNIEHKRVTVDVEHKRLTIEDSTICKEKDRNVSTDADETLNSKWFVCQICQSSFSNEEDIEVEF